MDRGGTPTPADDRESHNAILSRSLLGVFAGASKEAHASGTFDLRPAPGSPPIDAGIFRYFRSVKHLDDDLAVCDKALVLAEQLGDPALIAETRTIQGYVRMIKSIYVIANAIAGKEQLDDAETASLQTAWDELRSATQQTIDALNAWNRVVAPDCDLTKGFDPVGVTEQITADIGKALATFGIRGTRICPMGM